MAIGSLGSLVVRIEADVSKLNKGLQDANNRVRRTSGEITKSLSQIGRQMTIVGAAITGFFALATKSAIDFEDAFAGVRKTVDATEEEFKRLSSGLRKMATEIPIAATELAKIQEIAGQLGIRGVESLEKFTKIVAFIGITTNLTVEAAATDLARIAGIMEEPIKNIDRMGSVIVQLGNNSKATEAEIVAFTNRIAGSGKVAGLTTAELFAFGAAFTSVGVKAERGGTAVSKALIKMGVAVTEGGKQLDDFADIAGLTSDEFIKVYEEDGPGKVFALFIEGLGKAGLKGAAILEELELGNERIIQSFLSVGGATGILTKKLEMASKEWIANTALLKEAEERFKTTASQIKLLVNNVVEIGRKIGDTLLPVLKPLIDNLKEAAQKAAAWIEKNEELARKLTMAGVAIGLFLFSFGPLLILLPGLISFITLLGIKAGILVVGLKFVAAIGVVAFVGWGIQKVIDKLKEATGWLGKVSDLLDIISKFVFGEGITGLLGDKKEEDFEAPEVVETDRSFEEQLGFRPGEEEDITPLVPPIPEETKSEFEAFFSGLNNKIKNVGTSWGKALDFAKTKMISLQDLLNNVVTTFQKGFAKAISGVITGTTNFKQAIADLGKQLISMVIEFFAEWLIHQVLAKGLAVVAAAFAVTTAGLVAAAWAPAAAMASLATLGGNAVPASAALTGTTALARTLAIPALGEGGIITRPTVVLAGEAGPEAIIPLDRASSGGNKIVIENINVTVDEDADIDELVEKIGENIEEKLRRV